MDLKEVIKTLKVAKAEVEWQYPLDYAAAIDEAIKVLEKEELRGKVQKYKSSSDILMQLNVPKMPNVEKPRDDKKRMAQ